MAEGIRKARVPIPPSLVGYTLTATISVTQNSARSRVILYPWLRPSEKRTKTFVDIRKAYAVEAFDEGVDALYEALNVLGAKLGR